MKLKILIGLSLFSISAFSNSEMKRDQHIEKFWIQFEKNPKSAMNQMPFKLKKQKTKFSVEQIQSRNFVEIKDQNRVNQLCKDTLPGQKCTSIQNFSEIQSDSQNKLNSFFENETPITRLIEMENLNLLKAELDLKPWSGDYWAVYRGGIGHRYTGRNVVSSSDFQDHLKAFEKAKPIDLDNQSYLDTLSPAEKYDILVGDSRMSLTQYAWKEGKDYLSKMGKVEQWMGICHGWAPASYLAPRPTKTISIPIPGRTTHLKFYPDDLKALYSKLWATTTVKYTIIGGRCGDKEPKEDKNGRIISEQCFDTNPGAWHIALVNRLGIKKKSFVLDATYDYEVWNQPIVSYKYKYFNPQTKREYNQLSDAIISMKDFSRDKFSSYRSKNATQIVGVYMDLTYTTETLASDREENSEESDRTNTVTYIYDLEINSKGEIIGGEWYQNKHPDMIWSFPSNAKPISLFENRPLSTGWDPMSGGAVPVDWTKAAVNSSSFGQPLNSVIEVLQKLSQ